MKLSRHFTFLTSLPVFLLDSSLCASTITWTNGTATNQWSNAGNWDPAGEPTSSSDVTFPSGLAGTITTTTTENALSLTFEGNYTLSGGTLALASGNSISTSVGVTATIGNALTITGGLTKTGTGTLILGGSNTNAGGTIIQQGKIRAQNAGAMGAAGALTTVKDGATLEIGASITLDRPITLEHGATLSGTGTATGTGVTTVDAAATLVHFATGDAADLLSIGNGTNDLTGGSSASVIQPVGPGTVRLATASNYAGSWLLDQGRLELSVATSLGNDSARSVTLAGGTLSARNNTATSFTGSPGNQILVTADSTLLSDRSTPSSGVAHTFGNLSIGGQILTVAPGAGSTSGTAGITLGTATLTGNPVFHLPNSTATPRLALGGIDGGASARTITKTGGGELAITGGSSTLVSGSVLDFSGGGVLDLLYPDLGSDPLIAVSAAQNPLNQASISFSGGTLRLQANGANNSTTQTYQIATAISLSGEVTLDPLRRSNSGSNKTYELTGLTLAAGTELSVSGASTHGIRLSGPLALSGNAILGGVNVASRSSLLTLAGGITGTSSDSIEIRGGTSPLNLTLNASSTYGGGTTITGGNVTLNAADALGSGPIALNGGTLRVNGSTLLENNALTLAGGTLDIRSNTSTSFASSSLTISGSSALNIGNNGSGSSQIISLPDLIVSGDTTLTLSTSNSFTHTLSNLQLSGDLTLNHTGTARIGTITEDASPRSLIKSGLGTLELEAASDHSGGSKVLAGVLLVKHADALGSGALTLGATSGTSTATARIDPGLSIANDLLARAGSSGVLTLDAASGNVTWSGDVALERLLTLNNGSSTQPSTLTGEISGAGTLSKTGIGEWILTNSANSFGAGEANAVAISAGSITTAADATLGHAANGITLTSTGIFRASGTFATTRPFTFSGAGSATGIQVMADRTLTLAAPIAGTGAFAKSGTGTLEFAAAVDSSATRGPAAATTITAGTIRLQGPKNLGDGNILGLSGGTLELRADADTAFATALSVTGANTVLTDRTIDGSGTGGRHTLGSVALNSGGNLTVSNNNGYGLTLGSTSLEFSTTLSNQSTAPLRLATLTGNPGTSARTLTVGGSGDTEVLGTMTQGSGSGSYGITKSGSGTFRFGTAVSAFGGPMSVRDGTIDLNDLDHSIGLLTLGGATSASGATVATGSGTLTLTNGLTFATTGPAPDSFILGNVALSPVSHIFFIPSSSAAITEVTIDGPLTGSSGSALVKSSGGILKLAGTTANSPGPVAVNGGTLALAKPAGVNAIGADALTLNGGTVRLLADHQIPGTTPITIGSTITSTLTLNGFTDTIGGATLSQSGTFESSILATGADGTVVLTGDLVFNNNGNSTGALNRNILITGSGNRSTATFDGTLDLGGTTRTIHVTTTNATANAANANATIETRIINGGILKTGPRTLFLTNPNSTFSGGITIAEGSVRTTSNLALGTGPLTLSPTAGASATLDFGAAFGTHTGNFTISGSGTSSILFSGAAPTSLVLTGDFDLQSTLTVHVVNGSQSDDAGAMIDLTGLIDDGAATSGIVKTGQGILRLAAGNTFSGPTTVQQGVLSIPSDDALGDTDATLTLDGGLLHATASLTSPRDLVFGANGGGLRVNSPGVLEFTGDLTWGGGLTSFHGSGTTILSGTSSGTGGDLLIGRPMLFAPAPFPSPVIQTGHVLSLRGDVALPAGNIEFSNHAMLVLGSGDFIRPLGTGPGEFQMPTSTTVGWAAHGADRVVNIDGENPIIWGQESPRFLSASGTSTRGRLALGHASATHTVDFQSALELNSSTGGSSRTVIIGNGSATLDAILSGGFSNTPDPTARFRSLNFDGAGSAEVSGPLTGSIYINHIGTGSVTLSGDNSSHTGGLFADDEGTIIIAADSSFGQYDYIEAWEGGVIDATAMTDPVRCFPPENGYIGIEGTVIGDVIAPDYFYGNGHITGDLTAPAASYIEPGFDRMLHIGGDLTLQAGSELGIYPDGSEGLVPDEDFNRIRVTGTVTLAGAIDLYPGNLTSHFGETIVFLLNDGDDAIQGHFAGLPEGTALPIGDGLALQITYLANGDGGSVGNDAAFTVVEAIPGPDLAVTIDGPSDVAPGADFQVTLDVSNSGPGAATGITLFVSLPSNAEFTGSTPAGTIIPGDGEGGGETLAIGLGDLTELTTVQITLNFTAPPEITNVSISASLGGADDDIDPGNNFAFIDITVADPPGPEPELVITSYTFDITAGTGELTLDTIVGQSYTLQRSETLQSWDDLATYIGDGEPLTIPLTLESAPEFFRVRRTATISDQ